MNIHTDILYQYLDNLVVTVGAVELGSNFARADFAQHQAQIGGLSHARHPGIDHVGHGLAETPDKLHMVLVAGNRSFLRLRRLTGILNQ